MQKCPSTVGVVLISMAFTSCGGLALVVGVLVYFVLVMVFAFPVLISVIYCLLRYLQLTKMYENYLEDFVFSAATTIAKTVLGTDEKDADATATGSDEKDNETVVTETLKAIEKVEKDDESQDEDEEDEEQNLSDDEEVALIEPDGDNNFCSYLN